MPQSLVVLNGGTPGVTRHLTPGETVTIGRHPGRELPLDDERASRLHAKVYFRRGRWHIEDCGSLNGTQVNLQPTERAVLAPGDLIRIGEQLIMFADYATDGPAPGGARPAPTERLRKEDDDEDAAAQAWPTGLAGDADSAAAVLQRRTPIVGSSRAIREVLDQVSRVGPTPSTVLVLGESGTGKELIARVIHELSSRRGRAYVPVNCATINESLLESELFGHEEGAFTGASKRHEGQFERADGGTLFLDEIGEMSLACQAKLLRVLEGHPFQRVGGRDAIRVDVRVVAATHRDLAELVREGRFRGDLYYRLRVIDIRLPPLRARGDDVLELARQFLDQFSAEFGRGRLEFSADAKSALRAHAWPGNVRELRNAVQRGVVLGRGALLTARDLGLVEGATGAAEDLAGPATLDGAAQATVGGGDSEPAGAGATGAGSLRAAERRHILEVLAQVGGNKAKACRILGIGRGTLYKRLQEPE